MKIVLQRVSSASVAINGQEISTIQEGLLLLLGIGDSDDSSDAEILARKIPQLRIFEDKDGKMNLSLLDIGGSVLVVSQFTLFGDCTKGRRPSFCKAAQPEVADTLYRYFIEKLKDQGICVQTGEFGAMMDVKLINNGPVTLIIDSREN